MPAIVSLQCSYTHQILFVDMYVDKLKRAREVGKSLKRTKKVSLYRDSGEIQVASYHSVATLL